MFLKEYRSDFCGLNVSKVIMEIVLDRAGLSDMARELANTSLKDITNYLGDSVDKEATLNSICTYVFKFYDVSDIIQKDIRKHLMNFLLKSQHSKIEFEYAKNNFMTEFFMYDIKHKLDLPNIPEDSEDAIRKLIIQAVYNNHCGRFEFSSQTMIAFLRNAIKEYFALSYKNEIYAEINSIGTTFVTGEGDEISRVDLLDLPVEDRRDLPDFQRIARNIFEASRDCYKHNGEIFYDLFSRYKYNKLEKIVKDLNSRFTKVFKSASSFSRIEHRDINYKWSDKTAYRTAIKQAREKILIVMDQILDYSVSPERLKKIYERVKSINANDITLKDGKAFFSTVHNTVRGKANTEKFMDLVFSFTSLHALIRFLESEGISVFDVPSTIFQDESYIKRFKTLRQYLEDHDAVVKLAREPYEEIPYIPTNDQLYNSIVGDKLKLLSDVKFVSIKSILDGMEIANNSSKLKLGKLSLFSAFEGELVSSHHLEQQASKCLATLEKTREAMSTVGYLLKSQDTGSWNRAHEVFHGDVPESIKRDLKALMVPYSGESSFAERFPEFVKNDDQLMYNAYRYCSIKKVMSKHVKNMILEFRNLENELDLIEYLGKWNFMLELKSSPTSIHELVAFRSDSEIILCLPDYEPIETIESSYLMFYKDIYRLYGGFLNKIATYRDELYVKFESNFMTEEADLGTYSNKLLEYSAMLYNMDAHVTERLKTFMTICEVGTHGYIFKNGRPYTVDYLGSVTFLHERGYWISPDSKEEFKIRAVEESDSFFKGGR